MGRIVNWHIPRNGVPLPTFYMERDYLPEKVRIYAQDAPTGEFEVDIRDDGTSIFANQAASHKDTYDVDSIIGYIDLATSTFRDKEPITGGSSGAIATALEDSKFGIMRVKLTGSTVFTVAETITGGYSLATAEVTTFFLGHTHDRSRDDPERKSVILPKGENLEERAEDFPEDLPTIKEGSLLTCHVIQMGSANNVTVQLELSSVGEGD